jgi:hydroxyacylglutathione hydrolase
VLVAGFPAGSFQTNCYVLASGSGQACVVVDPGQDAVEPLEGLLAEHRLTPVAVLLTHGHFDHTFSVAPVCDGHDVPAFIHPDDRALLADPMKGFSRDALSGFGPLFFGGRLELREPREVRTLDDGASLELAGLTLRVDHTPGHTPGSVVFSTATAQGSAVVEVILAGDTLFAGSIGRTDLPGGDHATMLRSLRDKLLTRDDAAHVLPGHGPTTTIGRERASNPFLQGLVPAPGRGL